MTRETKIGLLVGMGFIIMFGIILSEHGARRRAVLPPRDQVATNGGGGAVRTGLARAPRPAATPIPGPVIVPDPMVVVRPAATPETPTRQVAVVSAHARPTKTATPTVANVLFSRPSAAPTVANRVAVDEGQLVTGMVYVVRRNDNLTRIAKRTMGSDSPKTVQLLFDANQDTLKSKNTIRVGQKLRIPLPRDQFARAGRRGNVAAAVNGVQLRAQAKPVSREAATFRWYQVKANDSWQKIAKQELGSEKRWRELYDLNRTKFPDPNRIRPGIRVKIPQTSRQVGQALADATNVTTAS